MTKGVHNMAAISMTRASLRFFGDDLDPDEMTRRLGASPSTARRKGEPMSGKATGMVRPAPKGSWLLKAAPREPGDLDAQVMEILNQLSGDLDAWQDLTSRFDADIFCGLFLNEWNEGAALGTQDLHALAARGLTIQFDICCKGRADGRGKRSIHK